MKIIFKHFSSSSETGKRKRTVLKSYIGVDVEVVVVIVVATVALPKVDHIGR